VEYEVDVADLLTLLVLLMCVLCRDEGSQMVAKAPTSCSCSALLHAFSSI
jgi:hypothetical protein